MTSKPLRGRPPGQKNKPQTDPDKRPVGRPPKIRLTEKRIATLGASIQIAVKLPVDLADRLSTKAKQNRINRAEQARRLIAQGLADSAEHDSGKKYE